MPECWSAPVIDCQSPKLQSARAKQTKALREQGERDKWRNGGIRRAYRTDEWHGVIQTQIGLVHTEEESSLAYASREPVSSSACRQALASPDSQHNTPRKKGQEENMICIREHRRTYTSKPSKKKNEKKRKNVQRDIATLPTPTPTKGTRSIKVKQHRTQVPSQLCLQPSMTVSGS